MTLRIAKVTGIVASGTSAITTHTSGTARPGLGSIVTNKASVFDSYSVSSSATTTARSTLATLLAPPRKPNTDHAAWPIAFVYGYWISAYIGVMGLFYAMKLPQFDHILSIVQPIVIVISIIYGIAVFLLFFRRILPWIRAYARRDAHTKDAQKALYPAVLALWQNAYYCYKHDVVFLPGQPTTRPPAEIDQLLWLSVSGAPPTLPNTK
jgi:hypothetical protein